MPLSVRLRRLPKPVLAAVMIVVGVAGRFALGGAANIEPVLILSMLAGALLGGMYVLLVPVAIMGVSDVLLYTFTYESTYGLGAILGLSAFVYTGFAFVAAAGGLAMRRRLVWRTRTIAVFTAISVPLTIAFDVWTAFGDWLFLAGPLGWTLTDVYVAQGVFTLIHVFSSLLFAPILGTTFLAVHLHGVPVPGPASAEVPDRSQ